MGGRSRNDQMVFDDGVAYKLKWKPMYEFVVNEGEAVLFPPGWIHETKNVHEGCTAALTTQFSLPSTPGYYRSYYPRLRRVGDLSPCWETMDRWASFGKRLPKDLSKLDGHSYAKRRFEEVDKNGDGYAVAGELGDEQSVGFYDVDLDGRVSEAEFVDL